MFLIGSFSVLGTRDNLVFHQATWILAQRAIDSGISMDDLDGGAAWDGYYNYDPANVNAIIQTDEVPIDFPERENFMLSGMPAWWIHLWSPNVSSKYFISTYPLDEYSVLDQEIYSVWLTGKSETLYLLTKGE